MKTASCLLVALMALAATSSSVHATGTLGDGPWAAKPASQIDSSAGSVMGPAAPANQSEGAPAKPGSLPTPSGSDPDGSTKTSKPGIPDDGGVNGGVAGGFQNKDPDVANRTSTSSSSGANAGSVSNSSASTPVSTKSGGAALATSVVAVVSVASTAAALSW